jgi:hypothetical protein
MKKRNIFLSSFVQLVSIECLLFEILFLELDLLTARLITKFQLIKLLHKLINQIR